MLTGYLLLSEHCKECVWSIIVLQRAETDFNSTLFYDRLGIEKL